MNEMRRNYDESLKYRLEQKASQFHLIKNQDLEDL